MWPPLQNGGSLIAFNFPNSDGLLLLLRSFYGRSETASFASVISSASGYRLSGQTAIAV